MDDDAMWLPVCAQAFVILVPEGEVRCVGGEVDGLRDLRITLADRLPGGAGHGCESPTTLGFHEVRC